MKKTLLILLLSVLTITAVTGCGDKTDTSQIESSSEQSTDSSDTSEVTDDNSESESAAVTGTFDWDTAMSQTTLVGKQVPMPFSVNDLGSNYRLGAISNDIFDGDGCGAHLYNTAYVHPETGRTIEKNLGYVSFDNVNAEEYTDDCKIGYVARMDDLCIQGIQEGVSMEQVYAAWGEPNEVINGVSYYYGDTDCSKAIIVYSDEENCVDQMNVDFEKDEN